MVVHALLSRFRKKKFEIKPSESGDIVDLLNKNKKYYAECESFITEKPLSEVIEEINLGLKIYDSGLDKEIQILENKSIIVIPPKYEFWAYFLITVNLTLLGYETTFLYHNWSKQLIEIIKPNLNYLKYQSMRFENLEDYDFLNSRSSNILNFSESTKGIPNTIPSFSTALIHGETDLDYVLAYIFTSTFSFAGLKKSSLRRIIVDLSMKEKFLSKLKSRIVSVDIKNASRIRSAKVRQQIHELVSDGISEGADLIIGSGEFDDNSYSNVILDEVDKDFRIYQKKFYGPILLLSYCDFSDPDQLKRYIQQQPSKGIVVFSDNQIKENAVFKELSNKYDFVFRPLTVDTDYANIIENYPSIELMIHLLKGKL